MRVFCTANILVPLNILQNELHWDRDSLRRIHTSPGIHTSRCHVTTTRIIILILHSFGNSGIKELYSFGLTSVAHRRRLHVRHRVGACQLTSHVTARLTPRKMSTCTDPDVCTNRIPAEDYSLVLASTR